jgi:hypothetical protein
MRWQVKPKLNIGVGSVRSRQKFLFFPLTIKDETRWFEVCEWREKFVSVCGIGRRWEPLEWLD